MFEKKQKAAQPEFWVAAQQLPTSPKSTFYSKLDETLESFGFAAKVRAICVPAYKQTGTGRPGIDPVVYLKMIMVGFFEDLPSERAIAARCADSMSIRAFLNYELDENTPDHSSFTVIRQRLGLDLYERIFTLSLQALREHGLLRGKNLGIDSSVIEANASLRALVHRNTEEQYWDYVKRLAAESGIDPDDAAAVRKFDRHRPGKGSNQEWVNPNDPDAKIGRTKDGATDMIYKPEAVVDLDTGAIVQAQVHPGDQADHKEMATRVMEAQQNINQATGENLDTLTVNTVTSDKGYYAVNELQALQQENIRTVIADPIANRRLDKLETDQKKAIQAGRRLLQSLPTHAEALRNWHAKATRGLRAAPFASTYFSLGRPSRNGAPTWFGSHPDLGVHLTEFFQSRHRSGLKIENASGNTALFNRLLDLVPAIGHVPAPGVK